jgi:hypothetical protein
MTRFVPSERQLPGWKSPCTKVFGRPEDSSWSMIPGSASRSTRALARSSADSRSPTSPASRASNATGRSRGSIAGVRSSSPAIAACTATHRLTTLRTVGRSGSQQSMPGACARSDHRFSRSTPSTPGASKGSYCWTCSMMSASTLPNRLVALAQAPPSEVGMRIRQDRFHVFTWVGIPWPTMPEAQSTRRRGPSTSAQVARNGCGLSTSAQAGSGVGSRTPGRGSAAAWT